MNKLNKQIFIINGAGGVGKDEFVKIVSSSDYNYKLVTETKNKTRIYVKVLEVGNYSSVSKVKKIAKMIGWDGSKTERNRKFLSDLKLLTTEYNDMPLNDMKQYADNFMNNEQTEDKILFLHIREPEEIAKAINEFKKYNAKSILIKRNSVKHITSNMADKNVYNYNYDIVIDNSGTIGDLKEKAEKFLNDFFANNLKNEY